jgi:uncharacterized glyoxalase superfamily protein PhnB
MFNDAATVFIVRNVPDSVAYYRDALGFKVAFLYGEPTIYAGFCRDNVTIHLQDASQTKRQAGQGSLYIFVKDVDAVYAEMKTRGARIIKPPADYDYGLRDFDLTDPDGNHLCFGMETPSKS